MDMLFKIITVALTAISVTAAVYNILTARTHQRDQQQKEKLDATHALAKQNELGLRSLEKRMDDCDVRTEKRLDQIGHDVAEVKKMFTDFIIDSLRAARP